MCNDAMIDNATAVITSTIDSFDYHADALRSVIELDIVILVYHANVIGNFLDMINAHCIRIDIYDRPRGRVLVSPCRLFVDISCLLEPTIKFP